MRRQLREALNWYQVVVRSQPDRIDPVYMNPILAAAQSVLEATEPDYKAHVRQNKALNVSDADARAIIDAAIGDRLLVEPIDP